MGIRKLFLKANLILFVFIYSLIYPHVMARWGMFAPPYKPENANYQNDSKDNGYRKTEQIKTSSSDTNSYNDSHIPLSTTGGSKCQQV